MRGPNGKWYSTDLACRSLLAEAWLLGKPGEFYRWWDVGIHYGRIYEVPEPDTVVVTSS
jgi:hypothetical protein